MASLNGVAGPLGRWPCQCTTLHRQITDSTGARHALCCLDPTRVVLERDDEENYIILGSSANSTVYKGVLVNDMETVPVAVKVPADWKRDEDRENFTCELQALEKLNSTKSTPKFFGAVILPPMGPALVIEFLPGKNMWDFVQNPPENFSRSDWLEMAVNLAECLHRIHDAGYLHNDLKMDNIIIHEQKDGTLVNTRPCTCLLAFPCSHVTICNLEMAPHDQCSWLLLFIRFPKSLILATPPNCGEA